MQFVGFTHHILHLCRLALRHRWRRSGTARGRGRGRWRRARFCRRCVVCPCRRRCVRPSACAHACATTRVSVCARACTRVSSRIPATVEASRRRICVYMYARLLWASCRAGLRAAPARVSGDCNVLQRPSRPHVCMHKHPWCVHVSMCVCVCVCVCVYVYICVYVCVRNK